MDYIDFPLDVKDVGEEAVSYCDFLNESGSTVGHIFHHLYADGSTSFSFAATPSGSRTADRRLSSLRIATNAVSPGADNTQSLGFNAGRWTQVFATTGTINTSDEREKLWRGDLTANELAAARRVVKELGFFQWSDAVGEKGEDDARFHFGIRAQQVVRIFMEEGVEATQNIEFDPAAYIQPEHRPSFRTAFLCFDSWQAKSEGRQRVTVSSVLGANGEPMQTVETENVAIHPAGNRFGLRVDQLAMFIAAALAADLESIDQARAGMAAQVTALTLRVAALEAAA